MGVYNLRLKAKILTEMIFKHYFIIAYYIYWHVIKRAGCKNSMPKNKIKSRARNAINDYLTKPPLITDDPRGENDWQNMIVLIETNFYFSIDKGQCLTFWKLMQMDYRHQVMHAGKN